MAERTIDIRGQRYTLLVYEMGKTYWVAAGDYLGDQIRTRGRTEGKAIRAWRRTVSFKYRPVVAAAKRARGGSARP
jgi:hypothetical protein